MCQALEIKISLNGVLGRQDISQFTGNSSGEIEGCRVTVGDPGQQKADAWFVIEDVNAEDSSCEVPRGQVHFLSAETAWAPSKYLSVEKKAFLDQFDRVHTFYTTRNRRVSFSPPFLPWMVHATHGSVFQPHSRDLNYFQELESLPKSQKISMFCSDQTWRPEHRRRLEFATAAKHYFGRDLAWFGNGINEVSEKWEGLAAFERTIVLENTTQKGVFSEKIFDPFLTLCQPIYSGAPDIGNYFPIEETQILDISDITGSLQRIARLLDKEISDRDRELTLLGKQAVLDQHHFLRRICRIAKRKASKKLGLTRYSKRFLLNSSHFSSAH